VRMRGWLSAIVLAGSLCYTAPSLAGSDPYSESSLDGYFLAEGTDFWHDGIAYVDLPAGILRDRLAALCKSHGRLWAFGRGEKFTCRSMATPPAQEILEGSNPYIITINGRVRGHAPHVSGRMPAVVFSLKPFRASSFVRRRPTPKELGCLKAALMQNQEDNHAALSSLRHGKVWTVRDLKEKAAFTIVRSDALIQGVDTYSNEYKYLVLRQLNDGSWNRVEIEGTIVGFIDLNGDGIPAIQLSQDCDGTCQYLVSVKDDLKRLLDISVH